VPGALTEPVRIPGLRSPSCTVLDKRLKPYDAFATMIERHWDGIAASCEPDNKVSLGLVAHGQPITFTPAPRATSIASTTAAYRR
jgi:hypothetical protein